jgi:LPXTG-motif cell wall-anchored protein
MSQTLVGRYESDLTVTLGSQRFGFADWRPAPGQGITTHYYAGPLGAGEAPLSAWPSLLLLIAIPLALIGLGILSRRRKRHG